MAHPTPFISVVVTTHLRPALLARCLNSLLDQDFEDFEIVLCADESSAPTRQVAGDLLRPQDSFIALPGRRGPAASRNVGNSVARGQWVCWLDDDDTFDSMHFESAAAVLAAAPGQVHHMNYEKVVEDRSGSEPRTVTHERVVVRELAASLLVFNSIPNNSYFVPRVLARSCLVDEALQSHEDWDYLLALQSKAPFIHHDQLGPKVHVGLDASRNRSAFQGGSAVLDFLSIYRRWPAPDPATRDARRQFISKMGLELPADFL